MLHDEFMLKTVIIIILMPVLDRERRRPPLVRRNRCAVRGAELCSLDNDWRAARRNSRVNVVVVVVVVVFAIACLVAAVVVGARHHAVSRRLNGARHCVVDGRQQQQ